MWRAAWLWLALSPGSGVEWQAPAECASAEAFESRVAPLRGDGSLDADLRFVITGSGPYVMEVVGQGARYEADDCEALVETALLLVSLALAPTRDELEPVEAELEPTRGIDADAEAADVGRFLGRPRRSPPRTRLPPPKPGGLQLELGLTTIITPRPAADLSLVAGPRARAWSLDLGLITRPSFAGDAPMPEVGARLWSVGGLARVCVGGRLQRIALAGCAGLELAAVQAHARGSVVESEPSTRPWLVAELGPMLAWPVSPRAALTLRVVGSWLAVQPDFRIAGAGRICCVDVLGFATRVGVDFGVGR